jgi:phytoene dehydrogenase-like protein
MTAHVPMNTGLDALVIGAGHNGLACALDLARQGRRVLVLEAATEAGGATRMRTLAPGFRVPGCAHLLHALPQSLVDDFELERHALRFAARGLATHALSGDGRAALRLDANGVHGADLPQADVTRYADFRRRMMRHAQALLPLLATIPPKLTLESWPDRLAMLRTGLRIRRLGRTGMRELLRIAGMNAYDLLDDEFSHPGLKGALAFDASLGAEYGPRSPGTVLTWLHRLAGEAGAGSLGIAQPVGGVAAVTDAMAAALRARGGALRTGARVERLLVAGDRVCGVRLEGGEEIAARTVVSSADVRRTFLGMLGAEHLDTGFVRRVVHHRAKGLVAKLHLALSEAPRFTGLAPADLGGRLLVSPDMDYLENAFNPSKYRELPEQPALEISLPTANDPTLAPPGQHVMSVLVQFVPYDLGPDPEGARRALEHSVMAVLERHAPGIGRLVVARELLTPADIEREYGLAGGHWHNGALAFDQFFINRPLPGAHQYRSPVPGLYLCGAASHPGGSLTGFAGRNAARQMLAEGLNP